MDNGIGTLLLLILWGLSGVAVFGVMVRAVWRVINSPAAIAICLALSALIVSLGLAQF